MTPGDEVASCWDPISMVCPMAHTMTHGIQGDSLPGIRTSLGDSLPGIRTSLDEGPALQRSCQISMLGIHVQGALAAMQRTARCFFLQLRTQIDAPSLHVFGTKDSTAFPESAVKGLMTFSQVSARTNERKSYQNFYHWQTLDHTPQSRKKQDI